MKLADNYATPLFRANRNLLVPWWLMSSFSYYVQYQPILSDGCFDMIVAMLTKDFTRIRHAHKWLIDRHRIYTGHYLMQWDYPSTIPGATEHVRQRVQ